MITEHLSASQKKKKKHAASQLGSFMEIKVNKLKKKKEASDEP